MRQAPGTQRGKDNDAYKVEQVGTEHRNKCALHIGTLGRDLRKRNDSFGKTALARKHHRNYRNDAHQHHNTLDEVVQNSGHITAKYHINAGNNRHTYHTPFVRQAKRHTEQTGKAVIDTGGIGNQEHEDDSRRSNAQPLRLVALAEKLGHGGGLQALRDLTRTRTKHPPCQQRTKEGIADANPKRRQAVFPAKLTCVANEDYRRKVAGAKSERRKPGAYVTAT